MKYRVWLSHSESDYYAWASNMIHETREAADRELEVLYIDSLNDCVAFEVREYIEESK